MGGAMQSFRRAQMAVRSFSAPPRGLLQRKCTCGGAAGLSGRCEACERARLSRRSMTGPAAPSTIPPIVHEVLRSPGEPLDSTTQKFMGRRFGHDFSRVRVYADVRAADAALSIDAMAFTAGQSIVFGGGQYSPHASRGRELLAHELAHVVQQNGNTRSSHLVLDSPIADGNEREAQASASQIGSENPISVGGVAKPATVQRMLVEERTGGCGVCARVTDIGNYAHEVIQEAFEATYGYVSTEFPFSSPGDDNGRLDLAVDLPGEIHIGEIKPANSKGYSKGNKDLVYYYDALTKAFPDKFIYLLDLTIPSPLDVFIDPAAPQCGQQTLLLNPPIGGVYGYYCEPPRSALRGDPNCQCPESKKKQPQEQPAPSPQPSPDQAPIPVLPLPSMPAIPPLPALGPGFVPVFP